MRILDKYIIRTFLWHYFIALFVMIGLYILVHLYLNLDEFTEEGQSAWHMAGNILRYYTYNLFLYFAQLAGLITIVGAAATLAKLQRANELTAILASGTSLYRVAAPILVMGLCMNGLWLVNQELIIPRIADRLARPPEDVQGTRSYHIRFVPDGEGGLLFARSYLPAKKQMRRMLLIRRDERGSLREILTADVATWDPQHRLWRLQRGARILKPEGNENDPALGQSRIERIGVTTYRTPLGPEELMQRQAAQWIEYLSLRQITQLQKRKMAPPIRLAKVKHARVTAPIMNMIMLVIGIYAFLHRAPRPIIADAGLSLLMCGTTFALTFVASNVVDVRSYPELPAWLPVMLFGPLAAILLDAVET